MLKYWKLFKSWIIFFYIELIDLEDSPTSEYFFYFNNFIFFRCPFDIFLILLTFCNYDYSSFIK